MLGSSKVDSASTPHIEPATVFNQLAIISEETKRIEVLLAGKVDRLTTDLNDMNSTDELTKRLDEVISTMASASININEKAASLCDNYEYFNNLVHTTNKYTQLYVLHVRFDELIETLSSCECDAESEFVTWKSKYLTLRSQIPSNVGVKRELAGLVASIWVSLNESRAQIVMIDENLSDLIALGEEKATILFELKMFDISPIEYQFEIFNRKLYDLLQLAVRHVRMSGEFERIKETCEESASEALVEIKSLNEKLNYFTSNVNGSNYNTYLAQMVHTVKTSQVLVLFDKMVNHFRQLVAYLHTHVGSDEVDSKHRVDGQIDLANEESEHGLEDAETPNEKIKRRRPAPRDMKRINDFDWEMTNMLESIKANSNESEANVRQLGESCHQLELMLPSKSKEANISLLMSHLTTALIAAKFAYRISMFRGCYLYPLMSSLACACVLGLSASFLVKDVKEREKKLTLLQHVGDMLHRVENSTLLFKYYLQEAESNAQSIQTHRNVEKESKAAQHGSSMFYMKYLRVYCDRTLKSTKIVAECLQAINKNNNNNNTMNAQFRSVLIM